MKNDFLRKGYKFLRNRNRRVLMLPPNINDYFVTTLVHPLSDSLLTNPNREEVFHIEVDPDTYNTREFYRGGVIKVNAITSSDDTRAKITLAMIDNLGSIMLDVRNEEVQKIPVEWISFQRKPLPSSIELHIISRLHNYLVDSQKKPNIYLYVGFFPSTQTI